MIIIENSHSDHDFDNIEVSSKWIIEIDIIKRVKYYRIQ